MVYEYFCPQCELYFDVVKSADFYDRKELCERCGESANRQFIPKYLYFNGTKVEDAEFNPGLGCITKNKKHREEIAKRKGLTEIGNEPPEKIHKHFEKVREEKREKAWEDVTKGWVGNGE